MMKLRGCWDILRTNYRQPVVYESAPVRAGLYYPDPGLACQARFGNGCWKRSQFPVGCQTSSQHNAGTASSSPVATLITGAPTVAASGVAA